MSNLDSSISEFTFKRNDIISENISENISEQNGGGILNDLFGNDDIEKLLLESFRDDRQDIACYILCKLNRCPKNICKQDDNGRNLLHYMTIYATHGNMVIHIGKIFRTCKKSNLKKSLDSQDKLGNTPVHYATELGFNNLIKLYIETGANIQIRNNKGQYISEDNSVSVSESKLALVLASESNSKSNSIPVDVGIIIPSPQSDERIINEENPIIVPFTETDSLGTIHFFEEIEKELNNKNYPAPASNNIDTNMVIINETTDSDTILTEQIIEEILNKTKKIEPFEIKSDIILDNKSSEQMIGGAKKKSKKQKKNKKLGRLVSGERKMTTYSEISAVSDKGLSDKSLSDKSLSDKSLSDKSLSKKSLYKLGISDLFINSDRVKSDKIKSSEYTISLQEAINSDDLNISDIARQINRQSSEIHERVVLKIIELLKLNKNSEEDMQKARNYKAAIYRMVKEKNPLLNNFDRAVEMEKLITLETLKSINIDKITKEIEKHLSEKSATLPTNSTNTTNSTNSTNSTKSESTETQDKKPKKNAKTPAKKTSKKTSKKTKAESSISASSDNLMTLEFSSVSQF